MKKCPKLAAFMAVLAIAIALVGTGCPSESSGGETFDIIIAPSDHGSITASPAKAAENDPVTLTIYPDTGYRLQSISVAPVGGGNVSLGGSGNNSGDTRTFNMPASNVRVTGVFTALPSPRTYKIELNVTGNGTVTYSSVPAKEVYDGTETYTGGETITITAGPDLGHSLGDVTVSHVNNGEPLDAPYTFTMPEANTTINVAFNAIQFNITKPAATDVVDLTEIPATASVGTPISFDLKIRTDDGDEGTGVWVPTVTVTGVPNVTIVGKRVSFLMPASAITITVTQREKKQAELGPALEIDTSGISNGTIDVFKADGETNVPDLTDVYKDQVIVFELVPNAGYLVKSVKIETNETPAKEVAWVREDGPENIYTFTMPDAGVTITVEWETIDGRVVVGFNGFTSESFMVTGSSSLYQGDSLYLNVWNLPQNCTGLVWFLDGNLTDVMDNWIGSSEFNYGGWYETVFGPAVPADVGNHTLTVIVFVGGDGTPGSGVPYSGTFNFRVVW